MRRFAELPWPRANIFFSQQTTSDFFPSLPSHINHSVHNHPPFFDSLSRLFHIYFLHNAGLPALQSCRLSQFLVLLPLGAN